MNVDKLHESCNNEIMEKSSFQVNVADYAKKNGN